MTDTLDLTRELIRCPSITPEDAGCMELIVERLAPLGFVAEFLDFGDTRNLWLRHGREAPLLVFLGHTDVVPPGPLEFWTTPPFEPVLRDGRLYGRGAADMKAGVAAMTMACARFVEDRPDHRGSVALLLTSDEEGPATCGVVKVVETLQSRGERIDWCLVGEPSCERAFGDTIKIGRRGSLNAHLRVHGVQGHVAYPHRAENPVHRFAPLLLELTRTVWDQGNAHFPPTSFQVSNIHAGIGADNMIPGLLDLKLNWRYSTELSMEAIQQRLRELLDRQGLRYELEWRSSGLPFLTTGGELIDAVQYGLRRVLGSEAQTSTAGGTSDGRFIAPTGAQVVELGPVNASIHKIDEYVAADEPERLAEVYRLVLHRLLA